ncbi:MAG: mucoidy inhibitor MuiA family protein [Deltaproteobacteria bacterium]|nr:mucoidy inhibitor MuiA family protein [Deltaproteobacteria bacterium]
MHALRFVYPLVLIMIIPFSCLFGQELKQVILYQDMAYLTMQLEAQGELVIETSADMIPDSISAIPGPQSALTNITIEPKRALSGKVQDLKGILKQKRTQLAIKEAQRSMILKQIEIIYKKAEVSGPEESFQKSKLEESLAYIDTAVSELNASQIRLTQEVDEFAAQINDLETRLKNISKQPGYTITINGQGTIVVSYALNNAHWRPEYRIYTTPDKNEVILDIFARLWQTTGRDWHTDQILLASGRPSFGVAAPRLDPWYIPQRFGAKMLRLEQATDQAIPEIEPVETATSYLIGLTKTTGLPGDGTPNTISIKKYTIETQLTRICIPKSDNHVFLRTEGIWDKDFPLLPGTYSAFVDQVFSGRGRFQRIDTGENLLIDLGQDETITIRRKETKRYHEKTITGKDKTTYSYTIDIENTRNRDIYITVQDQIPVSRDEKIKVDLLESTPETRPDEDGMLTWKLHLDGHAKHQINFSFAVTGDIFLKQ